MFIKNLAAICTLVFSGTSTYAQTKNDGEECFYAAVTEAVVTGDYQSVLNRYISVVDIAARISWSKWRIRWENLEPSRQEELITNIREILNQPRRQLFANVDLNSFEIRSEQKRNVFKIWGTYRENSSEKINSFEMLIYPEDCRVIYFIWNNVSLNWYIEIRM